MSTSDWPTPPTIARSARSAWSRSDRSTKSVWAGRTRRSAQPRVRSRKHPRTKTCFVRWSVWPVHPRPRTSWSRCSKTTWTRARRAATNATRCARASPDSSTPRGRTKRWRWRRGGVCWTSGPVMSKRSRRSCDWVRTSATRSRCRSRSNSWPTCTPSRRRRRTTFGRPRGSSKVAWTNATRRSRSTSTCSS